jgi:predicted nucleic acid-binding protein
LDFLLRFSNVDCVPVDIAVAEEAAMIRARYGITPPDALIVGTAIAAKADTIITNDSALVKLSPKPVILLSEFV